MNCQDINQLLDTTAQELTPAQRATIDRHLASCHACSEDWAHWREIAALPVPAMSPTLHARIAAALPAERAAPRRAFRPFVVGGLLLAGAALAATIALQLARRGAAPAPAVVAELPAATVRAVVQAAPPVADTAAATSITRKTMANIPVDPHRILVLKRPEAAADTAAIVLADRCYEAIVRELRTTGDLKIATVATSYTYASFADRIVLPEQERKVARAVGAGKVLGISTEMGCDATLYDSQTGAMDSGAGGGGVTAEGDHAERFGQGIAYGVRNKTLFDNTTLVSQARTAVLNTALSDRERAGALSQPQSLNPGGNSKGSRSFFDKEVVAAAIQIAARSADAEVRKAIWASLRGVDDASLAQPLLQALANDADASTRYQVAFDLHTFLGQPGVREALQRAAVEDSAQQPEWVTGWSVREAAQRAAVADNELRDWARGRLFDTSLPARSRLLNVQAVSPDGRWVRLASLGSDAALVVLDIGRHEQDAKVRAMAWDTLRLATPDAAFVPVLLGDIATHPDENVRAYAVRVLDQQIANPEVRAAFERARGDASIEVRRWVDVALAEAVNR